MMIYKIFTADQWVDLQTKGQTRGAPIDLSDGFIHFSTATQAEETAAKHFADQNNLILAAVDGQKLGSALKWEISRGDAEFPHLYRMLHLDEVIWHAPLPLIEGVHQFPRKMD